MNKKFDPIAAAAAQADTGTVMRMETFRVDPVRITVDLDPGLHAMMMSWAGARYGDVGAKVDLSAVVRELLTVLGFGPDNTDPDVVELSETLGAHVVGQLRVLYAARRAERRRAR